MPDFILKAYQSELADKQPRATTKIHAADLGEAADQARGHLAHGDKRITIDEVAGLAVGNPPSAGTAPSSSKPFTMSDSKLSDTDTLG